MNAKILSLILFAIILSTSVLATTGTVSPVWDYSEGSWDGTNIGAYAADYDYADYADCRGDDCTVQANFTMPSSVGFLNGLIWGQNMSLIVNGENMLLPAFADCFASGEPFRTLIFFNNSATPNATIYCEDRTSPNTWIPVHTANLTNTIASGQYLYWTDTAPSILMNDDINGSTKPCNDDFTRSSDIIFTATDSTDTEFECCVGIDGSYDLASCNSSIQNNTMSVLHTDRIVEGSQVVDVRCEDENGFGYSNSMTLIGEYCSCNASNFGDYITFAILCGLILYFGALLLGGAEFFSNNWHYVALFIIASIVLWWLQNWNSLC